MSSLQGDVNSPLNRVGFLELPEFLCEADVRVLREEIESNSQCSTRTAAGLRNAEERFASVRLLSGAEHVMRIVNSVLTKDAVLERLVCGWNVAPVELEPEVLACGYSEADDVERVVPSA